MQCGEGHSDDDCTCLTEGEIQSLKKLYRGPHTSDSDRIYPGFAMGSEYNWVPRIGESSPHFAGVATYRQLIHQDSDWQWQDFRLDEDVAVAREKLADIMDATEPDLSEFQAQGGKLIIWHGWNDPGIRAERSIQYYQSVQEEMGERPTRGFARLFLMPGVDHCGGGAGPDVFDGMEALVAWVENGDPPDRVRAENLTGEGEINLSRPLCPYPEVARWTGEGSTSDAENFRCELRGLDRADEAAGFENGDHGRNNSRRQQGP